MDSTATISTIITSMSTAMTTGASNMMTMLSTVVPIALGVVVAGMVVKYGVKVFRQLTK